MTGSTTYKPMGSTSHRHCSVKMALAQVLFHLSRPLHIYCLTLCTFYLLILRITEHLTSEMYLDYR